MFQKDLKTMKKLILDSENVYVKTNKLIKTCKNAGSLNIFGVDDYLSISYENQIRIYNKKLKY